MRGLYFNELVIETTYRCTAQCAHCYTSCGPRAPADLLSLEVAKRVIDESSLDTRIDKNITIAGGEATIHWDHLLGIIEHGNNCGFQVTLVTNAFWGSKREKAREKCKALLESGLLKLEISTDIFHDPYVSTNAVGHVIEEAKLAGLNVNIRIAVTKTSKTGDVLTRLNGFDLSKVLIIPQPAAPTGAGRQLPISDLYLNTKPPLGCCATQLNLTITPKGEVFPCCAGSELSQHLKLGNCYTHSISSILDNAERNLLVRKVIELGPAHLLDQLTPETAQLIGKRPFLNICDLCVTLFTTPSVALELQEKVIHEKKRALKKVIETIVPTFHE